MIKSYLNKGFMIDQGINPCFVCNYSFLFFNTCCCNHLFVFVDFLIKEFESSFSFFSRSFFIIAHASVRVHFEIRVEKRDARVYDLFVLFWHVRHFSGRRSVCVGWCRGGGLTSFKHFWKGNKKFWKGSSATLEVTLPQKTYRAYFRYITRLQRLNLQGSYEIVGAVATNFDAPFYFW